MLQQRWKETAKTDGRIAKGVEGGDLTKAQCLESF